MIEIEGYRLHYRIAGHGSPLVLIHGYGVSGHIWQRVLPYLTEQHKVVIVDLPGYGRSTYTGVWQLRAMAPLLARFLQRLDLPRVSLLGHSMGGAISVHLADYAPEMVERLVLTNSAGLPLQAKLSTLALRSLRSFVQREGGGYPPRLVLDTLRPHTRLLWQGAREMMRSDFRSELARIKIPTLIIWGARDLMLPLQLGYNLKENLPHAQLVILPPSGHRPMLTQPEEFSRIVLEFLQEEFE
jgi:pimeloyl-ACP methyl ester carboxylesterase